MDFSFSNGLRKEIDQVCFDHQDGYFAFHDLINPILKNHNISVETSTKTELCVKGRNHTADRDIRIVTFVYFYLQDLLNKNLIDFYKTASQACDIQLGDPSIHLTNPQCGYLSQKVSDFISENYNTFVLLSPEYYEYVGSGHLSQEVAIARKTKTISIISTIIAGISALLAIITIFFC